MRVTQAEERILLLVSRLHYVTNEQIRRRYYGRSIRLVRQLTNRLTAGGFLNRIASTPDGRGSLPDLFVLGRRGREHLASLGIDVPPLRRTDYLSPLHLAHTMAVGDILLAFERLEGTVACERYLHELDIARLNLPVKPDGWIDLRAENGALQVCYLLEVDRGTEAATRWKAKVRLLLSLVLGPDYRRAFGTEAFEGVIVAAPDEARCRQLGRWTAEELERLSRADLTSMFRFTTIAAASDPVWLELHL